MQGMIQLLPRQLAESCGVMSRPADLLCRSTRSASTEFRSCLSIITCARCTVYVSICRHVQPLSTSISLGAVCAGAHLRRQAHHACAVAVALHIRRGTAQHLNKAWLADAGRHMIRNSCSRDPLTDAAMVPCPSTRCKLLPADSCQHVVPCWGLPLASQTDAAVQSAMEELGTPLAHGITHGGAQYIGMVCPIQLGNVSGIERCSTGDNDSDAHKCFVRGLMSRLQAAIRIEDGYSISSLVHNQQLVSMSNMQAEIVNMKHRNSKCMITVMMPAWQQLGAMDASRDV